MTLWESLSREKRRQAERDNAKRPVQLEPVPKDRWPSLSSLPPEKQPVAVWRSRHFLVQLYEAPEPAMVRITVNRTDFTKVGWKEGISWDELQRLKFECGYGHYDAVEVYPSHDDIVHEANMRHLWVLREKLPFAWRKT